MADQLGFTAVKHAQAMGDGTVCNFMGVVVSLQDARKTRGINWMLDFTIQDDFTAGSVGGSSSMGCRVFKPSPQTLPKIVDVGDIVILRNFKLSSWKERMDCVSLPSSGVLVFPADKIPVLELSQAYLLGTQRLQCHTTPGAKEPTIQEQKAVLKLKHSSSSSAQDMRQHAAMVQTNTSNKRKEALIKDLTFDKFYDIKALVVNIYYTNHETVELKVTDYTAHKDLYEYVDPEMDRELAFRRDWRGPFGQVTMNVLLHEPHAAWARGHITNGDFIFLRNVRTKSSPQKYLEGVLYGDRQKPDQVDVRKLFEDSAIDDIKERRDAYEHRRSEQVTVHFVNAPKKPSAKASAKKKAEKKEKQRLQKAADVKELEEKQEAREAQRTGVNLNSEWREHL
jgi:protection-of-telomeres protein 1